MNEKSIGTLILPLLLVPLAVVIIIQILSRGGNQLGSTFLALSALGGLIGFFLPRAGMLLFLVLQFYTDFLKRLLILGDSLSQGDVMTTLGLGPVIVIMACTSCVIRCATGKVAFLNMRDVLFFLGCVCISVLGVAIGGLFSSAKDITTLGQSVLGTAMLGMTAYATYVLFRTKNDLRVMFKWMLIGAIPMGIYAIHQSIFGISRWEEEYVKTGLSPTIYNFYHVFGIAEVRPFSTLNLHTSLGAIGGTLFLISASIMSRSQQFFGGKNSGSTIYLLLSLLYLGTCIVSKNRTTYLLPIVGLILPWVFTSGLRILAFYLSATSAFVWIVMNSGWIHDNILDWNSTLGDSSLGKAFGTLGTFQDRLKSFMALSDSRNWSPFGLEENNRPFVHDQITELLIKLGYIPLTIIALTLSFCLVWWHRKCLTAATMNDKKFLNVLTGITISLGICGLAYGNLIFVAPVNSVLGTMIGAGMSMILLTRASTSPVTEISLEYLEKERLQTQPRDYTPGRRQRALPKKSASM